MKGGGETRSLPVGCLLCADGGVSPGECVYAIEEERRMEMGMRSCQVSFKCLCSNAVFGGLER